MVKIRPTRAAKKIVFKVPADVLRNTLIVHMIKICNSGSLNEETQRKETVTEFEKGIAPMYKMYQNPNV